MVGGNLVELLEEKQVLTQGSSRYCEYEANFSQGSYCEFELLFRQDLANILETTLNNIEMLRIQLRDEDSVLVFFRFIPMSSLYTYDFDWVREKIAHLESMVSTRLLVFPICAAVACYTYAASLCKYTRLKNQPQSSTMGT